MTEKKADAWMPLWIGAYLADTMNLTTIQHGAYLLLLMAYWRERKPLPDSDDELRSVAKLDKAEWKRMRPVLARFFRVADGQWWHKRVEQEMVDAEARSKNASEKASKAAQARWQAPDKHAPSMMQALLEDVLDDCPTPSPIEDTKEKARALLESFAQDPRLLTLREQGATDEDLLPIAAEAVAKGKGGAWIAAALVGRRADAAALALAPAVPISVARDPDAAERSRAYLDELASIKSTPPTPEFLALLRSVRTA